MCVFVRIVDYQLGHAPLLESLLEENVYEYIYKDNGSDFDNINNLKKIL